MAIKRRSAFHKRPRRQKNASPWGTIVTAFSSCRPGNVTCLGCGRRWHSPDRGRVRFCPKCSASQALERVEVRVYADPFRGR